MEAGLNFATVWERLATELADAIAISEPGRDLTYAAFEQRSARLATALAEAGIGPGDKVACYLYNSAAYLETVFAAFKLSAVPVNVNYRYGREELSSLLRDADAVALVFSAELAENVTHAARHLPKLRQLVRVGTIAASGEGPDAAELEELLATAPPRAPERRPGSDQLFMYTGGTTGAPKGVIWRQADLMHSLTVPIFAPLGEPQLPATLSRAVAVAVSARTEERAPTTMPVVPLMHATGLFNAMGALLVGGRVVVRSGGLDARHVWELMQRHRVGTIIVAGNAVCQPLVDELESAERSGAPRDLTSLRSVISSGTVLGDRLKRALHERAEVTIFDAIASSEGGPFALAITASVNDLPSRFFPVPGTKVLDAADAEVAPGSDAIGKLAYSGPMPLGYHREEHRSTTTFRTIRGVRYAIPGDLATVAADGAIRFLGRGSGVINTGGEKVHPLEVEEALLSHPEVTDVVVVGVPDERWGERVAAVAAVSTDGLTERALQDWVRRSLAGYKVPRTIVRLPALTRTPAGKLELAWAREVVQAQTSRPDDPAGRPARSRR